MTRPGTLGELRASGWVSRPVKEEVRAQRARAHRRGPAARRRRDRLRGHRPAAARERAPRRPRRDLPRRARPGEDPHDPLAHRAARRVDADRRRAARSTTTRTHPISQHARVLVAERGDETPIEWVHRDRRFGEKLATPDTSIADLIGEVDPIKVAEGRYLSDELTIHYGLVPRTNRGDLRDQRAPRPRRAHPGRSAQRARGARRADPRLQDPAAARRHARRVGQPRGLHQPRPHHHAAQGPLRRADPHALPARRRARGRDRRAGGAPARPPTASTCRCPRS